MMICLSAIEQGDFIGLNVTVPPIKENTRRLTRSATLDGGCVITDSGYSDGDQTFSFAFTNVTEDICDRLWAFFKSESMVNLSVHDGFFTGYLKSVSIKGGDVKISFLVKEKIT